MEELLRGSRDGTSTTGVCGTLEISSCVDCNHNYRLKLRSLVVRASGLEEKSARLMVPKIPGNAGGGTGPYRKTSLLKWNKDGDCGGAKNTH